MVSGLIAPVLFQPTGGGPGLRQDIGVGQLATISTSRRNRFTSKGRGKLGS